MRAELFAKRKLDDLASNTHISNQLIRVFLLENKTDSIGKPLISAFSVNQIVTAIPAIAHAEVVSAENYYNEIILRVKVNSQE